MSLAAIPLFSAPSLPLSLRTRERGRGRSLSALSPSLSSRQKKNLDSYKFGSSLISLYKFKLLGSYESSGYPLLMGV